ncbi:MFS general substrate transporter [Trichoderma citrinoviride]|uniref:MFS general substrate transporter n=1 Tax=Trichoderma citrinoviride TaxID=58853 RepID=A0A2T4BMD8_9HYPO|nr:MFS general substrate transporter [Trichoderma citrinoviride]PTB70440.1 MFS general substrate transporter [Trichoderma citrinoviride]
MEEPSGLLVKILSELGLVSLHHSRPDVKLLCLQRFVRLFAYGASTLVLVLYLQALGISKTRIGLFMTLTLVGDVCISFCLTLVADALGRKAILALGALLMTGSGVAFAFCENYWILLAAAIFGVISPSGNEIGPFRAIEESVVAHLTEPAARSDVYAWYSLLGTAGTAFGLMTGGWVVQYVSTGLEWQLIDAYRLIFFGYAVLGLVKLALALLLSSAVEADEEVTKRAVKASAEASNNETSPLLGNGLGNSQANEEQQESRGRIASLLPDISQEGYAILTSLSVFFALDAFASGLASMSWVTYFFRWRYGIAEGKLGSIFFVTSITSALSMLVASSLAKRFGNIKTMVFTHLPSSIFLSLIPVFPDVRLSLLFLWLRASSQSMDVAPRAAFLAAVIKPSERTAIMGVINVVKTVGASLGPFLTGTLADHGLFWVAFVTAGCLKASYDLGMLAVFQNHERHAAERERQRQSAEENAAAPA